MGSAMSVVTVNAILQGQQGGERHLTKQSAITTEVSIWKQAPHLHHKYIEQ
jgi:hypothetical protein